MRRLILVAILFLVLGGAASQTFTAYVQSLPAATQMTSSDSLYLLQGGKSKSISPGNAGLAFLNTPDQTMSGGANVVSFANGTITSGVVTVDCGKAPLQYLTNRGAFTLAAPVNDGSCIVVATNGVGAGAIGFSGFNEGTNTGDSLDTTNGHSFAISVTRINSLSHYLVSAYQ